MAIDDVPDPKPSMVQTTKSDHSGRFAAIFVILALLIIGEIYSFTRFSSLRSDLQTQQALLNKRMSAELSNKIQDLQNANAQSLDELRSELDSTITQMSKTQKTALARAHYAGYLVKKLEREENQNAQELRQALAQNVSNTKSDLASTKKTMDTLAKDLGMARSNLGTLIATNHQDIVALQK